MKKKALVSLIFFLIAGYFMGVFRINLLNQIIGPSHSDTKFVGICGELNGKTFTFQNIQQLNGSCYVSTGNNSVGVERCHEQHVNDYLNRVKTGVELKILEISQGPLDGSWRCSLTYVEKDSTIKAVPNYAYD